MALDDIYTLNGTTVSWKHAQTRFTSISVEQAKSVTKRGYQDLLKVGKFVEAEAFLYEVTGIHSAAYLEAHPEADEADVLENELDEG